LRGLLPLPPTAIVETPGVRDRLYDREVGN